MRMSKFFRYERLLGMFDRKRGDTLSLTAINKVNKQTNDDIQWTSDQETHGDIDYWQMPSFTESLGKGDCEDIAILKWHRLLKLGLGREYMSFGWCEWAGTTTSRPITHMVLIVEFEDLHLVLDNITSTVTDVNNRTDLINMKYKFKRKRDMNCITKYVLDYLDDKA